MLDISKEHPEIIKQTDKKIAKKLNYDGTEFPVQEKYFNKIEMKNNICINVFGYETRFVFSSLCFRSKIWRLYRFVAFK